MMMAPAHISDVGIYFASSVMECNTVVTTAGVAALLLVAFAYIGWYLYLVFGKRANPFFSSQYVSTAFAPLQKLGAKPQAKAFAKLKTAQPAQPKKLSFAKAKTSKPPQITVQKPAQTKLNNISKAKTSKPPQTIVRKPPQSQAIFAKPTVQKPAHVMPAKLQAGKPAAKPISFKRKK